MDGLAFIPFVLHAIVAPEVSVAAVDVNSLPGCNLKAHTWAEGWDQRLLCFRPFLHFSFETAWGAQMRCRRGDKEEGLEKGERCEVRDIPGKWRLPSVYFIDLNQRRGPWLGKCVYLWAVRTYCIIKDRHLLDREGLRGHHIQLRPTTRISSDISGRFYSILSISNDRKLIDIRAGTFGYIVISLLSVTSFLPSELGTWFWSSIHPPPPCVKGRIITGLRSCGEPIFLPSEWFWQGHENVT